MYIIDSTVVVRLKRNESKTSLNHFATHLMNYGNDVAHLNDTH